MSQLTLAALRRLYRQALLAAPIAVAACGETPAVNTPTNSADAGAAPAPEASSSAVSEPVAPGGCQHGPMRNVGCGGGEMPINGSLEACGLPKSGEIPKERCDALCAPMQVSGCSVSQGSSEPAIFCHSANPCLGRPDSAGALEAATSPRLLQHLALAARMEAISVGAFHELAEDLERWGAPARLLRGCRRAAADEARHAASTRALLQSRGGRPSPRGGRRRRGFASLAALAIHNERHGVVGETWGALVALHQAEHAADRDVRETMSAIAQEESEHAALSLAIARWVRKNLPPETARRLDQERRAALADLAATLGYRPARDAAKELGWPSPEKSRAMIDVLAPAMAAPAIEADDSPAGGQAQRARLSAREN